jgi:mannose-6-phosphate isomerase
MLYPLKFESVYKDYAWGGRELEKFGKNIPEGTVGESWEVSTNPAGESKVINGKYQGLKLSEVVKKLGVKLIGDALPEKYIEKFPLLIKFIDANDNLSVQVHPDDEYAGIHEKGESGRSELLYVISAKPGAKIAYGVAAGTSREDFQEAVEKGNIESCLNFVEVSEGDAFNIPGGLVHAIGEGIVMAKIQQNSNAACRIKEKLQIENALDVVKFNNCKTKGRLKPLNIAAAGNSKKTYLMTNNYFGVEKYTVDGEVREEAAGSRFVIYTCLDGEGQINYTGGYEKISRGESVLIPAFLGEYSIEGNLQLLKTYAVNLQD